MIKQPRLKYCYQAEFLGDETILLTSEKNNVYLSGKAYSLVLSLIHQTGAAVDELIAALEGQLSAFEVIYALDVLEKQGYITEAASNLSQPTCAYWNSLGIEVNSLLNVLEDKAVSIETLGQVPQEIFLQALDTMGVKTGETGEFKVVITDDYQRQELVQINRQALKTGQPWMLFKPVGVESWLGPIFLPGKTGCWECLEQRLSINRPINTFHKIQKNTRENLRIPAAYVPLSIQGAVSTAVIEIVRWLYAGENERLAGKLVAIDTHTLTVQSHVLVKRPQCKTCGDHLDNRQEPGPIIPKKKFSYCVSSAGGYREVSPETTLEKYRHHVSPITGVVQFLKPYHHIKGTPIYNYSSGSNTALRSKTLYWLNSHFRSANGGKGKTWAQAKAGALCEAIERYSLTYQGDEPYIISSLKELTSQGIHPNACMNFSEKQFQDREVSNRTCNRLYALVPVHFDESLKMRWTPVYSLTHQGFKYLPSCFCYAQFPAEDESALFSYPDSNGCAAGNSLEEAILQGFLELVERDSVALWWYNMHRKPAVDLPGFNNPYFLQLIEYYKSLGRSLYVLDITADLQIPAFAAISHRPGEKRENIVFGFGAHVDAAIAIERALIELNQILPVVNAPGSNGSKGNYLTSDKTFVDWLNNATMKNQPYLAPLENVPVKKFPEYPPLCKSSIYDSLMFCIDKAASQGLETLVLDLTRRDVGLPVVKVIVPGMRHFWRRLAPGRLYDVPVKMKWLDRPLKEEETNPVGLFI